MQTVRYGPYGENTNTSGTVAYSTTNDPFLFQGGYHTSGGNTGVGNIPNGLYHYGARYYDPTTGRWTQPDAAGGGYEFGGGDPVNEQDPNGTCPFDRNVQPSISTHGNYTYLQICGSHGGRAGKTIGYVRVAHYKGCLVDFGGTFSTCQQVLERFNQETTAQQNGMGSLKEAYGVVKCGLELYKGSGACANP